MRHSHADKTPACEQVKKLKANLEDARRRMGAQSRSLQQHWRRGITMGDTVRLLSDVNSIVDTPQRLQKLEEAKASFSPTCPWHQDLQDRNTGFRILEGL